MGSFNLSDWALRHRPLVLYFMVVIGLAGLFSYGKLGQSEDPPFTFKAMTIRTIWPGATASEIDQQVTERIERKLQEVPHIQYLRSYSRPGESLVLFIVDDALHASAVPDVHYQVRKRLGDIRATLPVGTIGPAFNDEFGDTFGNIFAITGEGYSAADQKFYAERIRRELMRVPDVAKVEVFGEQDEKLYIEISNAKLATLGFDLATVVAAMQAQNAVAPSGYFETASDRIYVRSSGSFTDDAALRNLTLRVNNRAFKLGDIATVRRGLAEPAFTKMRYMGRPSLGLGVAMQSGGDIVTLGKNLDAAILRVEKNLPVGIEIHRANDQPRSVRASVGEFVRSLAEAIAIVMAVTFFSLGLRSGLVVALSIPLVLAATFVGMNFFNVGLHKISLGALILSLGLLVDDAIIAVEMMAIKMEQGMDRVKAASYAYTSTAFPMLTGTLVTAAGFLPIVTAKSGTGEYTISIFQVTVIALLLSWVAAVIFIPYLGYYFLPDYKAERENNKNGQTRLSTWLSGLPLIGRWWARPARAVVNHAPHDVYGTAFYLRVLAAVRWCVDHRRTVIALTVILFIGALAAFGQLQQQFFPSSTRVELIVDLKHAEGASLTATDNTLKKFEQFLDGQKSLFENYTTYIGTGAPRFYLPLDQTLPVPSIGQVVITTNDIEARETLRQRIIEIFERDFPAIRGRVTRLENGPPVGFPVQFRVSGEDRDKLRAYAEDVAKLMRADTDLVNVQLDWTDQAKVIVLDIDQDKARLLGISSADIATFFQSSLIGVTATTLRERDKQIDIVVRGAEAERTQLSMLESLTMPTRAGRAVPITQFARVSYRFEDSLIWRRDRLPTITVRADIYRAGVQAPTVSIRLQKALAPISATFSPGYHLEAGGAIEETLKGQRSIGKGVPLFLFVVFTVLMLQLKSFQRVLIVVLTAPLGLIGVVLFLFVFNKPFGFVAMLGTIALFGMIMRNSVILIDQIEQDISAGVAPYLAVIDATVRRLRPIALTALAAILAMVPLTRSAFFGPMAVAIMGGLLVATLLTIFFLPALYAAWFRVPQAQNVSA